MRAFAASIVFMAVGKALVTLARPLPSSHTSSPSFPKYIQEDMEASKKIINDLGDHRITQLEEALKQLKVNQAPALESSTYDTFPTQPYYHATMSLHYPIKVRTLEKQLKKAKKHVNELKGKKHSGHEVAKQLHEDLETVHGWTKFGEDPHDTFKEHNTLANSSEAESSSSSVTHQDSHPIFRPIVPANEEHLDRIDGQRIFRAGRPTNNARRPQIDPTVREAEIERLEKEHQIVLAILHRHKDLS